VTGQCCEVLLRGGQADPTNCYCRVPNGGLLSVGGTITIADKARLVTVSHPTNGVSARIVTRDLTIAAGGMVWTEGQGFIGGTPTGFYDYPTHIPGHTHWGYGPVGRYLDLIYYPGRSVFYDQPLGGSHGGRGGNVSEEETRVPYDDEDMPHMPGSGGAARDLSSGLGGNGGGVVYIDVVRNTRFDGTINANGKSSAGGGGAGGAVYLKTRRLRFGENASVTANGATQGAGGRVAIWRASDLAGSLPADEVLARLSASADTNRSDCNPQPQPGTVVFGYGMGPGLMLIVK